MVLYRFARYALSVAVEVDEVKDIRDKAAAMAAYARQAQDKELLQWATEIKVRAERRAGEMMRDMEKAKGGRPEITVSTMLPVNPVLRVLLTKFLRKSSTTLIVVYAYCDRTQLSA